MEGGSRKQTSENFMMEVDRYSGLALISPSLLSSLNIAMIPGGTAAII